MWQGFINLVPPYTNESHREELLTQMFDSQIVTRKLSFVIG